MQPGRELWLAIAWLVSCPYGRLEGVYRNGWTTAQPSPKKGSGDTQAINLRDGAEDWAQIDAIIARARRGEIDGDTLAHAIIDVARAWTGLDGANLSIVDLGAGRLSHVEALVRWDHPQRGLMQPDRFVPMAEESGLIGLLTQAVLRLALGQCRDWRQQGLEIDVAVNLSADNLRDPQVVQMVMESLRANGLPPACLRLEFAEAAVMANQGQTLDALTQLSTAGIRLSVDDFGPGYSSVAHLSHLPMHDIKIDGSVVQHVATQRANTITASAIVGLGHRLGWRVIAEGVETHTAWDALAALDCDLAQGYLVCHPLPADRLASWLRRGSKERRRRTNT